MSKTLLKYRPNMKITRKLTGKRYKSVVTFSKLLRNQFRNRYITVIISLYLKKYEMRDNAEVISSREGLIRRGSFADILEAKALKF